MCYDDDKLSTAAEGYLELIDMSHGGRVAALRERIVRQLDLTRSRSNTVKSATHIHLYSHNMTRPFLNVKASTHTHLHTP